MSTQAILDSSPIALPPVRPLKRSASTASLPTPPRTLDKKKSRARSTHDSDTESNYSQDDSDGEKEEDRIVLGRKKRRTTKALKGQDEEDNENAFWTGRGSSSRTRGSKAKADATEESDNSPTALLERRMQMQISPISPPPSKRRQANTTPPITPESAGSSSRMLTRAGKRLALRDSPENPFLDDSPPSVAGSPTPRTPVSHEEKPLVTYVFRGMKAQFANPLYNLPASAHERSRLPIEHPDYEAPETCPPKLLFPSAHVRNRRESPVRNEVAAKKPREKTQKRKQDSLEQTDSLRAGAVAGGRDDPIRRATGPVRAAKR